ncbi:MAG: hypothetical protein IJU92_04650 [Spirochaetaceae bacterium]|nr:hypothetical protein [Spirochaetaceae bacterium]
MKKFFTILSVFVIFCCFASCKQGNKGTSLKTEYAFLSATAEAGLQFIEESKEFSFVWYSTEGTVECEGSYTVSGNNVTLTIKNGMAGSGTPTPVNSGTLNATLSDGGNKITVKGKVSTVDVNVTLTSVPTP